MMAGKSRRARVPVQALVEVADLARAISHVEPSAGPDGPVAAAHAIAGFEHCAIIAGLVELVGRREPGHTSAEHGDLGSVTVAGFERQRLGDGGCAQESHRLHGEVGGAIASSLRDPTQEVPTGAAHPNLVLFFATRVYRKPDSDMMVMHSAEERIRANAADPPNCGQDRVSRRIELP